MQVSILYNANDSLLVNSKTSKPIVVSKALTNLEKIQNHQSASDIVDFEKSTGKPGEMLIVFAKINDKDSCSFIYSDSKRLFYKNLSSVSQIIRSIQIFS